MGFFLSGQRQFSATFRLTGLKLNFHNHLWTSIEQPLFYTKRWCSYFIWWKLNIGNHTFFAKNVVLYVPPTTVINWILTSVMTTTKFFIRQRYTISSCKLMFWEIISWDFRFRIDFKVYCTFIVTCKTLIKPKNLFTIILSRWIEPTLKTKSCLVVSYSSKRTVLYMYVYNISLNKTDITLQELYMHPVVVKF